ncbi:hypothetical protein SmJEL517_g03831 [Synchytrium microbalum]|uniref:DUF221-domain-containing protein n=1 Tax=Synchytrium microbalum TaxID=1806994 RepID=A0A507BWF4_9FUNG|nr:uncharacterized protein SmJEL517_g03831 [Synchytrium microbalum]TPX33167.1 hypothetical protein SmJEL517_g03831 [Synchytrium microbalum]
MSAINSTNSTDETIVKFTVSTQSLLSSLLINSLVGLLLVMVYSALRLYVRSVYDPRKSGTKKSLRNPFAWIAEAIYASDVHIYERAGLDALVFSRFNWMAIELFTVMSFFSIVILLPINVVGGLKLGGIEELNIGNIIDDRRLWAHLVLTILYSLFLMYRLSQGMESFVKLRHAWLISKSKKPASATVLFLNVPSELSSVAKMSALFEGVLPIQEVIFSKDVLTLESDIKKRSSILHKLEKVLARYIIRTAKVGGSPAKTYTPPVEAAALCGQIRDLTTRITNLQDPERTSHPDLPVAFVRFDSTTHAQVAAQLVLHSDLTKMAPVYAGADLPPEEIVWSNLATPGWSRLSRKYIAQVLSLTIILFFSIPSTAISALANISAVIPSVPWLAFLLQNSLAVGVFQSLIPPILLSLLLLLAPLAFTLLAQFEGHVSKVDISRSVADRFFALLILNVFLIIGLTGGVIQSVSSIINNPTSVIDTLAQRVPNSANFFLSYVLLRGFLGGALELIQAWSLIVKWVVPRFFQQTPRILLSRRQTIVPDMSVMIPFTSLVLCLGIIFSTLAPIMPLATLAYFGVTQVVYRNNFLTIYKSHDTGGLLYPHAVKQVYVGIILQLLTTLGIFILKQAFYQTVIIIIALIAIIAWVHESGRYDRVFPFLPLSTILNRKQKQTGGLINLTTNSQPPSINNTPRPSTNTIPTLRVVPPPVQEEENHNNFRTMVGSNLDRLSKALYLERIRVRFGLNAEPVHDDLVVPSTRTSISEPAVPEQDADSVPQDGDLSLPREDKEEADISAPATAQSSAGETSGPMTYLADTRGDSEATLHDQEKRLPRGSPNKFDTLLSQKSRRVVEKHWAQSAYQNPALKHIPEAVWLPEDDLGLSHYLATTLSQEYGIEFVVGDGCWVTKGRFGGAWMHMDARPREEVVELDDLRRNNTGKMPACPEFPQFVIFTTKSFAMKKTDSRKKLAAATRPLMSPEHVLAWANSLGFGCVASQTDVEVKIELDQSYNQAIRSIDLEEDLPETITTWKHQIEAKRQRRMELIAKRDRLLDSVSAAKKRVDTLKQECRAESMGIQAGVQNVARLRESWLDKMSRVELLQVSRQSEVQQAAVYQKYSQLIQSLKDSNVKSVSGFVFEDTYLRVFSNVFHKPKNDALLSDFDNCLCEVQDAIGTSKATEKLTQVVNIAKKFPAAELLSTLHAKMLTDSTKHLIPATTPSQKRSLEEWNLIHDAAQHHVNRFQQVEKLIAEASDYKTRCSGAVSEIERLLMQRMSKDETNEALSLIIAKVERDASQAALDHAVALLNIAVHQRDARQAESTLKGLEDESLYLAARLKSLKSVVTGLLKSSRQPILHAISENVEYASYGGRLSDDLASAMKSSSESSLALYKSIPQQGVGHLFKPSSLGLFLVSRESPIISGSRRPMEHRVTEIQELKRKDHHLNQVLAQELEPSLKSWKDTLDSLSNKLSLPRSETFLPDFVNLLTNTVEGHAVACQTRYIPALNTALEESRVCQDIMNKEIVDILAERELVHKIVL